MPVPKTKRTVGGSLARSQRSLGNPVQSPSPAIPDSGSTTIRRRHMSDSFDSSLSNPMSRRRFVATAGIAAGSLVAGTAMAAEGAVTKASTAAKPALGKRHAESALFKTKDGVELFYKDWGTGQPIFFHHGWPLSSDDWDAQMVFFLAKGFRVIAYDRRGHGRSTQTITGNDMDTYASDVAELVRHLDLKDAIHIGHSTGGGEVARYVAQHGEG